MRESIGGTWIFTVVIIFILLFTSYLAVTLNYSKAFNVKNGVISILEEEEGWTNDAQERIINYLNGSGYRNLGKCPVDESNNSKAGGYQNNDNNKYSYCIKKVDNYDKNEPQKAYYEITLFFSLDLPFFGDFATFKVNGRTTEIFYPGDCSIWNEC